MEWRFRKQETGYDSQGIRDGDIEIFDKNRYGSVIRESIQNSLDAVLDENKPVEVNFILGSINQKNYSSLFQVIERLKACKGNTSNEDDLELINRMLGELKSSEVETLEISDYNTKGMVSQNTYNDFASGRNASSKQHKGSAGSKGMGKAAYFALSPMRTILVTSRTEKNNILFQGITRIATHKISNETYYHKGFFGLRDFDPVEDVNLIPQEYMRIEPGTTIRIIGLWQDENRVEEMKIALLNNFWLAIAENKLIVRINDQLFDATTLESSILAMWPELDESGHYNTNGNPRPYYETFLQRSKISKIFSKADLPQLGSLKLYLSKNDKFPPRIAFFRKSRMLIYKQNLLFKGYSGVLICDDDKGNETLKRMENAVHDEWNPKNWKNPKANEAKKELDAFIEECKAAFLGENDAEELTIPGLSDFISIGKPGTPGAGSGSSKGTGKITVQERSDDPREKPPKPLKDLFIYAQNKGSGIIYNIVLDSNLQQDEFEFELIAGSDNDAITEDNKLVPITTSKGVIDGNRIKIELAIGVNRVQVELDDEEKHALYLRRIESL